MGPMEGAESTEKLRRGLFELMKLLLNLKGK